MPCLMEQPQRKSSAECDKAELAEHHRQRVAVDGENNDLPQVGEEAKVEIGPLIDIFALGRQACAAADHNVGSAVANCPVKGRSVTTSAGSLV